VDEAVAVGSYLSRVRGGFKLNCQRARELIDPFLDGELDLSQVVEFRQHVGECEDCNVAYRNQLILSSTLKDDALYYRAPQNLQNRIRLSWRQEVGVAQLLQQTH
jgi:Putative zinc-finger